MRALQVGAQFPCESWSRVAPIGNVKSHFRKETVA